MVKDGLGLVVLVISVERGGRRRVAGCDRYLEGLQVTVEMRSQTHWVASTLDATEVRLLIVRKANERTCSQLQQVISTLLCAVVGLGADCT